MLVVRVQVFERSAEGGGGGGLSADAVRGRDGCDWLFTRPGAVRRHPIRIAVIQVRGYAISLRST